MQNIYKTTILASLIATLATLSACSSDSKPQPITIINPTPAAAPAPMVMTPPSTTTVITQPPAGSSMPSSSTTYYNTPPRSY